MARRKSKDGSNKSDMIRALFASNPSISTAEVMKTMADKGMKVSPALVYHLKRKKKGTGKRGRPPGSGASRTGGNTSVGLIVRAKELARDVGGLQNLRQLVDALAD